MSYWRHRPTPEPGPATEPSPAGAPGPVGEPGPSSSLSPGPAAADVLVVGGGLTGLTTALELRRCAPGLSVLLVEAGVVGAGASGRNAGMLVPVTGAPWLLPGALPEADAAWALSALAARSAATLTWARELGCEIDEASFVLATPSGPAEAAAQWLGRRLGAHGVDTDWWSAATLEERTGERARGALCVPAHRVDPWRLCRTLRGRAIEAGVVLREHTAITEVVPDATGVRVAVAGGGELHGRHVVLAAGGWGPGLSPDLAARGGVYRTAMLATSPLSRAQLRRLGGEVMLTVSVTPGFPYRRVVDGRLLFGGLDDRVSDPPLDAGASEDIERRLRRLLVDRLPWLDNPEVELSWQGPIHAAALHELPTFTRATSSPAITLAGGMSGSGVIWGLMAGGLVRGLVRPDLDDPDSRRLRECLARTRVPWLAGAGLGARWLFQGLFRS